MIALAAVSLSLLLSQGMPVSKRQLPIGDTAYLTADESVYDTEEKSVKATGHAVLRSGQVHIRADELDYDETTGVAHGKGNVLYASGFLAATADEMTVDLDTEELTAENGVFMQKRRVLPEQLIQATTADALTNMGQTSVVVRGKKVRRLNADEFEIDGLRFTPCDCNPTKPTWHVEAASANLIPGERATLWWPVIYVYKLPVFAAPWMYLPLADRRSGMLFPKPNVTTNNGFNLDVPVFITLGQSYDMTVTPGYYFGGAANPDGSSVTGYGIKGPRLDTEFRYAPTEKTFGRLTLDLVDDLWIRRSAIPDPVSGFINQQAGHKRGLRGAGSIQQTQDLGGGFYDRVDLSLLSDGYYVRDLVTDILLRENQYTRSTAAVYRVDSDSYLGLDVALRQDLRWGYSLFGHDLANDLSATRGPNTFDRLPALRYVLPERWLVGPVFGSLALEYTRLAPLNAEFGDEGSFGIFDPAKLSLTQLASLNDGTEGNGRFDPGEREARDRLDLRPRLSASFKAGPYATFTPYVSYREDLYLGELTGTTAQRGYPLGGFILDTELSRTFGPQGNFRHTVTPQIELRYVPAVFGLAAPNPYDEIDRAVTADGMLQAVAEVSQRLMMRSGNSVRELVKLDIGQGMDLKRQTLADTFARAASTLGPVVVDLVGRYNLEEQRITQVSGSAAFNSGHGLLAYAKFDHLVTDGSDRLRRGIDELVGEPSWQFLGLSSSQPLHACRDASDIPCWQPAQLLQVGASYNFKFGLGLRYDALVTPIRTDGFLIDRVAQQSIGVSYGPACDCWRVEAHAVLRSPAPGTVVPHAPLTGWTTDFGFNVTIAKFGSLGNGR